jgi:chondroitin 4-sulfotransferase 11
MISHPHRCIFVHIPKTAGNSVNRVFGVDWQNHKDLARYAAELPPDIFSTYFKFAIVRNPWDRLYSDYNYQRKKSRAKESKLFLFDSGGRQRDFAAWVETALAEPDFYEPRQWGGEVSSHIHRWSPQLDWISLNGTAAVDFVARMETLDRSFPTVCRRVGLPEQRLPHRNGRLHLHYSRSYDRTTRELVASYYAKDIAAFGYEFEERSLHRRYFFGTDRAHPKTVSDASSNSNRFTSAPVSKRRPLGRPPVAALIAVVVIALLLISRHRLAFSFR